MHTYVTLNDDIYTLDTPAEIAHARKHMAEEPRVESLPIYLGGPDDEGVPTGETLYAAGEPPPDLHDLPVDEDIARVLMTLIDPASDEDMRDEAMEMITGSGLSVGVLSYADAGMLTRDQGFIIRIGRAEFQVTVLPR